MNSKRKALLTAVCAVLLVVASVMGTVAYMTMQASAVTNTFIATAGLIDDPIIPPEPTPGPTLDDNGLYLYESKATAGADGNYTLSTTEFVTSNSYKAAPGAVIAKNPWVGVEGKTDTPAYVFISVKNDASEYVSFTVDSTHWIKLDDVSCANGDVYVYSADGSTPTALISDLDVTYILKDNQVKVSDSATQSQLATAFGTDGKSIVFNAYLTQSAGFESASAAFVGCGYGSAK